MKLYSYNQIDKAGLYPWAKKHLKEVMKITTECGGMSQSTYYVYSEQYKEYTKNLKAIYIDDSYLKYLK
jgi:hypothetical protein